MSSSVPRRLFAAAGTALLAALLASSVVSAAPRPITFNVVIGDTCVFGRAPNNSFLKLVIRDASGNLKGRGALEADRQGYWQACLGEGNGAIVAGDRITARVFDTNRSRTFTVPLLTGNIDRGTNVVSGKAPSGSTIELEAFDFRWEPWGESYDVQHSVIASGGKFAYDFDSDSVDIRGGASVVIRWRSAGDSVLVGRFQIAPYLNMEIGRPEVAGASHANGAIKITLTNGSTTLASAMGVGSYGDTSFHAIFARADGEPYTVKGGENLTAPELGGQSSWRIPKINPTADLAADTVSGTCFANGRVMALAQNLDGFGYGSDAGVAASDGRFTIDLSSQVDIGHGFRLAVLCYSPDGDEIVQQTTVR